MDNEGAVNGRMYASAGSTLDGYRKPNDVHPGRMSLPANLDSSGLQSSFAPSGTGEPGAVTTSGAGGAVSADAGGVDSGEVADGKRRKRPGARTSGEKGKGLRHFSLKVCEKVESKGRTTYNEVADELVAEITGPDRSLLPQDQQQYDEKNIRRRVYDALNVLMAMDIISKEKKEIKWKGLPPSSGSHETLEAEKEKLLERLEKKRASNQELQEQVAAIERLIRRNETSYQNGGTPPGSGVGLPFILVQTRPQATVEVEISEDMQLVHFDFGSTPFELHDDSFVLRAMGLASPPLDDVFPPGGSGPLLSSPPGPAPQGLQQIGDRSVALAATHSAPQPGMSSGYSHGMSHLPQGSAYTALSRSASAGQNQQAQQVPPVPPLPYNSALAVGQHPSAGGLPQLPMSQLPVMLQGSQLPLQGQGQHQPQQILAQHEVVPPLGSAQGQMFSYQTGQYSSTLPQVGSGGNLSAYGGYQEPPSHLRDQHSQPMQAVQYGSQFGGTFSNQGVPATQYQQATSMQQQQHSGQLPQQQQQLPVYAQISGYQQQNPNQTTQPLSYSTQQSANQYSAPGSMEQMGMSYQQQLPAQHQQIMQNASQPSASSATQFMPPPPTPQMFYQQSSTGQT